VFADPRFWLGLFEYTAKTPEAWSVDALASTKEPAGGQVSNSLRNIVGLFGIDTEISKTNHNAKAYDLLVNVLFQMKLDFEAISEIMIALARRAKIDMENVRGSLSRNQDLLVSQIALLSRTKSMEITDKDLDLPYGRRETRLVKVLKLAVRYLDSGCEIIRLTHLNRFLRNKSRSIFKRTLATFDFTHWRAFRKMIYVKLTPSFYRIEPLENHFDPELRPIISMDVQRTTSKHPSFNAPALERILNNLSHPEVGNFPYYQGMNYLTAYFYQLFEGDELKTFNFIIWISERDLAEYFDKDLRNVRKLFFCLKKFLRRSLPKLSEFLEAQMKIDTDVIFAAWCLTLFTTVLQNQETTPILDEIIDLFVSRGWPGFFQAVLVIMSELQPRLINMSYDTVLMLLNELGKNNFKELLVGHPPDMSWRLKSRAIRFETITYAKMKNYELEFEQSEMRIGKVWDRIDAKINESKEASAT
jgi:hypothetical protein